MSLFTNALAGASSAGAEIANKYLDEKILRDRAQVLAELQRQSAKTIREDDDAFKNDPTRIARDRENRVADVQAVGTAQSEVALAGERAKVTDERLNQGRRDQAARDAALAHQTKIDQTMADAKNPAYLKAVADIENASPGKRAETDLKRAQASKENAYAGYLRSGGKSGGGGGKADKMDESDKIEYTNLFGDVKEAMKNKAKFEAEGMPLDENGAPTPQYALVQKNVGAANRKLLQFQMRKGLIDAEDMASDAIAGENDSAKIGAAIAQAYALGGGDFGDKFFESVRKSGALERNSEEAAAKAAPAGGRASRGSGEPAVKEPARYGLFSSARVKYLEGIKSRGQIDEAGQTELDQLLQSRDKAWFRGRASEASYE